jgi:eukaryotic-like serine/threonine-protein kinase
VRSDRNQLDETLAQLRDGGAVDVDATLVDARKTIEPAKRNDTAGQRALAVLAQLSAGASPTASGAITLERTLGQGGMGVVHLATQAAVGRKVAVKTLRDDRRSEPHAMQLLREAWVLGALEHPNVVPIYDLGLDAGGHPYIVLKRIEGVQWAELMHDDAKVRERFGAEDLLDWNLQNFIQVSNALSFAHSRGILHRDLKPENVMIGEFGEVYVLDWGIAVSLRDDGSGRLPLAGADRELCGTPVYMAPEMLEGAVRVSERTDVYLLGGVLYEILTGHAPHEGETVKEILSKVFESNPPFPDGLDPELVRICRRALAPDPDARFENVQQLRLAIQGYLRRRGSAQLVHEAQASLARLEAELAAPAGATRRQRLYNLFGECRFGFQQALKTWRDNQAAHDGLLRATTAMIEYELGDGDPRAAAVLAGGLDAVPPALATRIADAARAQAAARERAHELEKIGGDYDFSVGRRTRVVLSAVAGTIWTVLPLALRPTALYESYSGMLLAPVGLLVVMSGLAIWARESMSKTAINRALVKSVLLTMVSQIALHAGTWLVGMPVHMSQTLDLFAWFVIAAMLSLTIDRRLLPGALGYLAGFFAACARPELVYLAMAGSNFVLTVTMVGVWRARRPARAG